MMDASEAEERLLRDKMSNYNKLIRPVNNLTHPVHVQFGMSMVQLIRYAFGRSGQITRIEMIVLLHRRL